MKTITLTRAESAAYTNGERRFWRAMRRPEYFGCLTGDCPHVYQRDCDESIAALLVPDCPYGNPGDRIDVSRYYPVPPFRLIENLPITAITVEQRNGRWGWVLEVGA